MAFTKIVATVGPSCDRVEQLTTLINTGVSVFRFNLKHNTQEWHSVRIKRVEEASQKLGKPVATLLDFQGPEIRIGSFHGKSGISLSEGEQVYFVTSENSNYEKAIILNNLELLKRLNPGQKILLDAGAFVFEVVKNEQDKVLTKVLTGGVLTARKSVNIPGIELSLPTLAQKDLEDIELASRQKVDFVALSYVREKKDIETFRTALKKQKVNADIIAKIETRSAIDNLDEIIKTADGVMVARGDLGVEFPLEQVPFLQKEIIRKCLYLGRPVITATQMLETMTESPQPTRAEVSDVANAVYDRSDALMLSAESAIGAYPKEVVSMMQKIAHFTEMSVSSQTGIKYQILHQTEAVTYGAFQLWQSEFCQRKKIKAFVTLTETGMTARMLSRLRPKIPIIALTRHKSVADKLCLVYGVAPLIHSFEDKSPYDKKEAVHIQRILQVIKKNHVVKNGDKVIMIYGEDWGTAGKTSIVRIQEVE